MERDAALLGAGRGRPLELAAVSGGERGHRVHGRVDDQGGGAAPMGRGPDEPERVGPVDRERPDLEVAATVGRQQHLGAVLFARCQTGDVDRHLPAADLVGGSHRGAGAAALVAHDDRGVRRVADADDRRGEDLVGGELRGAGGPGEGGGEGEPETKAGPQRPLVVEDHADRRGHHRGEHRPPSVRGEHVRPERPAAARRRAPAG